MTHRELLYEIRDYVYITLGLLLYTFGFTVFLLPYQIVTGGIAGVGAIVFYATQFPVQYTFFIINAVLIVASLKILGWKFLTKTVYATLMLTLMLEVAQDMMMMPDGSFRKLLGEGNDFMSLIIGCSITGTALAIVFLNNGSTGGTDIVAAMVSKYRQISVGRMILYVDLFVISSSYFIKYNIEPVVYGYVVLIFLSYMCDMVVNNNKQAVQFSVFSKKWSAIATAVNAEMHRGCTILEGTGWYTKQEVKMLLIFSRKSEALQVYRIIYSIDPNAFVSQGNVNTIYGEGFDKSKVKAKIRDLKDGGTGQPHQP